MESLEIISEKVQNIENNTNKANTIKTLNNAFKGLAKREAITRGLTITITTDEITTGDLLIAMIDQYYQSSLPNQKWKDKNNLYIRFANINDMEKFIKVTGQTGGPLSNIGMRVKKNEDGTNKALERKPVRLEVQMVRESIKLDTIKEALKKLMIDGMIFTDIKEGKMIQNTKCRQISFKANAQALEVLYQNLDGIIELERTRLYPRISCRPFMCRDCYSLSPMHQCKGKCCNNCGNNTHKASDCKSKTRFCANCKSPGHRAKDSIFKRFSKKSEKLIFP